MDKIIPAGWKIVNFGDVVNKINDRVPNRDEWTFDKFVSGGHIDSEQVRVTKFSPILGNEEKIGSAFHMKFQPEHVLYVSRRAYLRKGGMVDFEGICSNTTFILQADESRLLQSLVPFIIQTEDFVKHTTDNSHGSTNPFLNWKDIAKYRLLLPPLEEQKKISKILWSIEENAEKIGNLINATKVLKEGLFNELLTKGIGHTNFKKTEMGDIPDEWDFCGFKDVINVNPSRKMTKGKTSTFVAMADIMECQEKIQTISKKVYKGGGAKFANEDTLLARITPCLENGKTAYVDVLDERELGFGSTEFIILSGKKNTTLSKYVYYIATSPFFRKIAISSMSGTTGRQRVPNDFFDTISIGIPPIDEQKEIIHIFDFFNTNILKYNNHLTSLSVLKKKLTNDYLSGKLIIPAEVL